MEFLKKKGVKSVSVGAYDPRGEMKYLCLFTPEVMNNQKISQWVEEFAKANKVSTSSNYYPASYHIRFEDYYYD